MTDTHDHAFPRPEATHPITDMYGHTVFTGSVLGFIGDDIPGVYIGLYDPDDADRDSRAILPPPVLVLERDMALALARDILDVATEPYI